MKRYYIKHEDVYFVEMETYNWEAIGETGYSFEWSPDRSRAKMFSFRQDALNYSAGLRKGPRQFGGLGSKARVISVGT